MKWRWIVSFAFILFFVSGEFLLAESLRKTKLNKTGVGDIVSATVYLERVVKQGNGFIIYDKGTKEILNEIKIPTYYKKGQNIDEVINNFCNLYRVVTYRFYKNRVKLFLISNNKMIRQNAQLDYNYRFGDFILGTGIGLQYDLKDDPIDESEKLNMLMDDIPIYLSIEWLISSHLGFEFYYAKYWKKDNNDSSVFEYNLFNFMTKLYFSPTGAGFFIGTGLSYYTIKYKIGTTWFDSWDGENGVDNDNLAFTVAAGLNIRFGKRFVFGLKFMQGFPGMQSISGGLYVKL